MGIKKLFSFKNPALVKQMKVTKIDKEYGGIIHQLELDDFWHNLLGDERAFLRNCTKWSFGGRIQPKELDHPDSYVKTKRNACGFLLGNASWAYESKEYMLAEKLLKEIINRSNNCFVLHRTYQLLIKMYYLLSAENCKSLTKCKEYCGYHIEMSPLLLIESLNKDIKPPDILAFRVLKEILIKEAKRDEYENILILEQQYNRGEINEGD
jgi:hypothetical protein